MTKSTLIVLILLLAGSTGIPSPSFAQEDSLAVSLLGHIDLWSWSNAADIAYDGDYAYVACGTPSLYVIDMTYPTAPVEAGRLFLDADPGHIVLADNEIAVLSGRQMAYFIDISNPEAPSMLGSVPTPDATNVAVSGSIACVTRLEGLTVVDFSDPSQPIILAELPSPVILSYPAFHDDLLAVLLDGTNIALIDMSNPVNPELTSEIEWDADEYFPLAIVGDTLFRLAWQGLFAWDVSDPANPQLLGSYGFIAHNNSKLVVEADRAYVMLTVNDLLVLDISDPSNMQLITQYDYGDVVGTPYGLDVSNDRLVCCDHNNVLSLDVTDPGDIQILNTYIPPDQAGPICTDEDRIYIQLDSGGIRGYDISDPGSPSMLSTWPLEGDYPATTLLGVHQGLAYVRRLQSLEVYDVSQPGVFFLYDSLYLDYNPHQMLFRGDRGYISVGSNGFPDEGGAMMLALPPQHDLELLWSDIHGGWITPDIDLDGSHLIVDGGEILIYDFTTGMEPVEVGSGWTTTGGRGFSVNDDIAWVCSYGLSYSVLHIYDLHDLDDIHEIRSWTFTEQWPSQVEARGDQLCINMTAYEPSSGMGGMWVMDIKDPTVRQIRGYHKDLKFLEWMSPGRALVSGDGFIGVADISGATAVDDLIASEGVGTDKTFTLMPTYPNPFNPTATVRVSTHTPGQVSVTVHDLLGRTVVQLGGQQMSAGIHLWTIDGSSWASGVYIVQAQGPGGHMLSERITLVK